MMMNYSSTMFMTLLILTSMYSTMINSMLMMWLIIEINSLAMIMIISNKEKMILNIKYLIIQSICSSLLLMIIILQKMMNYSIVSNSSSMIIVIMLIKSAMPPFHSWMTQMLENMKKETFFLLMTVQKIIPFMVMSFFNINKIIMYFLLMTIMSNIFAMKQKSIIKMMFFSSSSHSAWIIIAMMINPLMSLAYLSVYMMNLMSMMSFMFYKKKKKIFNIGLMSMMGMPPFIGFIIKVIVFKEMMMNFYLETYAFIMMIITIASSTVYLKSMYNIMFNTNNNKKNNKMNNIKSIMLIIQTIPLIYLMDDMEMM